MSKERKNCLCTAMLYDPEQYKQQPGKKPWEFARQSKIYERLTRLKQLNFIKAFREKKKNSV